MRTGSIVADDVTLQLADRRGVHHFVQQRAQILAALVETQTRLGQIERKKLDGNFPEGLQVPARLIPKRFGRMQHQRGARRARYDDVFALYVEAGVSLRMADLNDATHCHTFSQQRQGASRRSRRSGDLNRSSAFSYANDYYAASCRPSTHHRASPARRRSALDDTHPI
ncbi:MAG: hypothetical protein ABW171_07230 [Steroidobacter sp.]